MSYSRDTVIATPELLESILSHLPLPHLLQANLISRHFHNTILSSPRLQQALHLRPNPSGSPCNWAINPLLRNAFLPFFVLPLDRFSGAPTYDDFCRMDWIEHRSEAFLRESASWRRMCIVQPPPTTLQIVHMTHAQAGDFYDRTSIPLPFPVEYQPLSNQGTPERGHESPKYVTMGLIYDIVEAFLEAYTNSFGSFTLYFKDTPGGPQIVLYFETTMQCCPTSPVEPRYRSKGAIAGVHLYHLYAQWGEQSAGREDVKVSALTEERGGVPKWEWREWGRKRAGLGDLISDVR